MNKEQLLQTVKVAKENSKKRKFVQGVDLIINLKNVDLKKQKIQSYINLPFIVKKPRIGAFVESALKKEAEACCELVITKEEFSKYKDKKLSKKTFSQVDFFISQANLMPLVASSFGKVLGPKGKMPDPKIGAVIPPNGNVKVVSDKLKSITKLEAKGGNMIKTIVGKEDMDDNNIVSNILAIYENIIHILPNEKENIKNLIIKLSMGAPVKAGEKDEDIKNRMKTKEENLLKLKERRQKEAEKNRKKPKKIIAAVKEEKKYEAKEKEEDKKPTKKKEIKKDG